MEFQVHERLGRHDVGQRPDAVVEQVDEVVVALTDDLDEEVELEVEVGVEVRMSACHKPVKQTKTWRLGER